MGKRGFLFSCLVLLTGTVTAVFSAPHLSMIPHGAGFSPSRKMTPLACKHLKHIAQWTNQKHARPPQSWAHPKQGAATAKAFLELLDPYKILFTKKTQNRFIEMAQKQWPKAIKKGNCAFFKKWLAKGYEKHKNAFLKRTHQLSLTPFLIGTVAHDKAYPKPNHYAKNPAQLKNRTKEMARAILARTKKSVYRAYGKDKKLIVKQVLRNDILRPKWTAAELLTKAALKSMDAYSIYFSEEEFDDFYADLTGTTTGIGIQVKKVPLGLLIEKVLKDSPAGRSKIKKGDIITRIDKVSVARLSQKKAKRLLKGQEAEAIELGLFRKAKSFTVKLKRQPVTLEEAKVTSNVHVSKKKDKVAVLTIPSFYGTGGLKAEKNKSASDDFKTALKKLLKRNQPKALVVDLRGNPGGYLDEAVEIASLFIGGKPVVGIFENDRRKVLSTPYAKPLYTGPMVVLVDEESASASEVLAGALRDYQRAVIVGSSKTFGKGSIQRMYPLEDTVPSWPNLAGTKKVPGAVKVTTSYYYSPNGKSPAGGVGIQSDVVLKKTIAKKKKKAIPSVAPLVDGKEVAKLNQTKPIFTQRIKSLAKRSQKRRKAIRNWTADEGQGLSEAIEIASDLAALNPQLARISE